MEVSSVEEREALFTTAHGPEGWMEKQLFFDS